jgi:hypothetical protein
MIVPTGKRNAAFDDYVVAYMTGLGVSRSEAERYTRTDIGLGVFKPSDWTEIEYAELDDYVEARVAAGK